MSKPNADLQKRTNHLATSLERMATAGATMPRKFATQIDRLQHLTTLIRPLLATVVGEALADSCQVVYATDTKLTLTLPSMTAVNHARYLHTSCLDALKSQEDFSAITELHFIVSMAHKNQKTTHQNTKTHPKKSLDESIKQTITQTTDIVITHPQLRANLLKLLNNIKVKDDNHS